MNGVLPPVIYTQLPVASFRCFAGNFTYFMFLLVSALKVVMYTSE